MKRDISNMSMFQGLTPLIHNDVVDPDFIPTDSEMDNILKEIFSVDERTGLPNGDLAYYLSPDGNPQIKQWLENNLLKPRAARVGSSVEGVTDDMLAEFAKQKDESSFEYANRLKGLYDAATKEIEDFKLKQHENE